MFQSLPEVLRVFGVKRRETLPFSLGNFIDTCADIQFFPSGVCLSPAADGAGTEVSYFVPIFQRELARVHAQTLMGMEPDFKLEVEE